MKSILPLSTLATAIAGAAEVIVAGDHDLLDLESHEGIRILSPRRWLEQTARAAPTD